MVPKVGLLEVKQAQDVMGGFVRGGPSIVTSAAVVGRFIWDDLCQNKARRLIQVDHRFMFL
jgi:hypothetical protein